MALNSAGDNTAATIPGRHWDAFDRPRDAGFDPAALAAFGAAIEGPLTTSFMVVAQGRVAFQMGDVSEASYLASTRKSILSMLYGPHVAAGRINLDLTLEQLGVDDVQGLLPIERQARIRDILTSRSGVYYPAGSPGGDEQDVPARGLHPPGTRFHYNNWDFNVAGAIFEQLTGSSVHDALRDQLAVPLGFEDFDRSRQRMLGYPDRSRFLAYHMFLSCRDMARIGLLALREGRWGRMQLVPAAWMRESVTLRVPSSAMPGRFHNRGLGYGYYWWIPERHGQPEWAGAFLAAGHYGQFILGLPQLDLVLVHRRAITDTRALNRNSGVDLGDLRAVSAVEMVQMAEQVLACRL